MFVTKCIKAAASMLCVYKYTDANANPHTPVVINLYIACSKESHSTVCAIPNITMLMPAYKSLLLNVALAP